jgi:putative hydrolase of the HAD superfamily
VTARAVLLDALGTLVELQPPAPRLRAGLQAEGFELSEERAAAGFRAEIEYYLDHHLEGSSRAALDGLRDRCAAVMMEALDLPGLDHATARRAMLGALEFRPYDDVLPTLPALRDGGARLVVASNWDCSLPDWLGSAGLLELFDGIVTSATAGVAKPDPRLFRRALEVAGVDAGDAVHVGDSIANDVEGARAAGVRAVLVTRSAEPSPGVETIRSLYELPTLLS